MNRFLIGILIGALLALVLYSVLTEGCPSAGEIVTSWDELADAYASGEISMDEYVRRADRLIECSERRRGRWKRDE